MQLTEPFTDYENVLFSGVAFTQQGKATEEDVAEGEDVKVEDEGAETPKKDAVAGTEKVMFAFLVFWGALGFRGP